MPDQAICLQLFGKKIFIPKALSISSSWRGIPCTSALACWANGDSHAPCICTADSASTAAFCSLPLSTDTIDQFFFQLKNCKRSLGYKVHPQQMEQHLKGPDLQHLLKADPCNISHAIHSHRQFLPSHCRGVPLIGMPKRPRTQQSQCQFGMPQLQRQLSMKLRAKRHFSH